MRLEQELTELERTNPEVRAAARKYDDAIRRILAGQRAKQADTKSLVPCCAATLDDHGRYCVGFCGPDCLRRSGVSQ
jgi:hypothetical protein